MSTQDYPVPVLPFERKAIAKAVSPEAAAFSHTRSVSRRDFLKAGSVLVIGVSLFGCTEGEQEQVAETPALTLSGPWAPDVYVSFDAEGTVTIISHRSEMGQGIKTSLPAVVADEMEADWNRVVVEQATGDKKFGDQSTGGSLSVISFFQRMREAGASVRLLLEQAAAQQWGVAVSECSAQQHKVVHKGSDKSADFSELLAVASQLPMPTPDQLTLKTPDQYRYIGKSLKIVDMHEMTHGTARYGADIRVPGMKFAAIARPPVVFGKVKSYDATKALSVKGVQSVVELPALEPPAVYKALGGVAVIADSSWAALKARDLLSIEWDDGANADYDSDSFKQALLEAVRQPGATQRDDGNFDEAHASAASTLEAEYYAPHLGHMMMEPPAAMADVRADFCEVWAPTQDPQSLVGMATAISGLSEDKVRINMSLLGSAFGRKGKGDYVNEALFLSKEVGAPVLVQWSREDEVRHGYYHTVSAQQLSAGLDENGKVSAWRHRVAYPSIMSTFNPTVRAPAMLEMGQGVVNLPYVIENIRVEAGEADAKARIGWLRSVCTIFQSFAINSFTDEIAHARGIDPVENLLELLGSDRTIDLTQLGMENNEGHPFETGRLRGVIELAAKKASWGRELPKGHGLGIAAQYSFDTYAAAVIEVAVGEDGAWRVPRVDFAIDCGQVVNVDRVTAQQEGAAVFGLGLARYGNITMTGGRVDQGNFNDSRVVRFGLDPETHVHLVDSHAAPSGVGEPGVPPFAPALANAIFAATGKRIRELPIGNTI